MGKGDIKTKKGKRTMGSFGVSRPRKKATSIVPVIEKAAAKKVKTVKAEKPAEENVEKVKKVTKKKKVD